MAADDVIRRTLSLRRSEESRLLAAVEKDRGANFSHWLVGVGLARADAIGVPPVVAEPPSRRLGRPPKTGTKPSVQEGRTRSAPRAKAVPRKPRRPR